MGQVPTVDSAPFGIVGDGRVARHFHYYFSLLGLSVRTWSRRVPDPSPPVVFDDIVGSGVPVMGHVGLTPQSVHQFGGFRVQGRDDGAATQICRQAHLLEDLGCFALVLECVPVALAARLTSELRIPTIGIGAGAGTDCQILVLQDLLGADTSRTPRFVRRYLDGERLLTDALNRFDADVKVASFPSAEESYT